MKSMTNELDPVQNLGWIDRTARIAIGMALIVAVLMNAFGNELNYLAIVSIYPCMTGLLGWDPLYSLARVKRCDVSSPHNKCGTYMSEIASAVGEEAVCNPDYKGCIAGSHRAQEVA